MQIVEPHSTILVLNSSYEPLHFTNWKRAIILLFKDKAKLISKRVIRLVNYVRLPFIRLGETFPSRNLIYKRDNYECQYCGSKKNLTIDHVKPRSKGGNDTWTNLVTACSSCNVKKGSKTLKESGLILKSTPRAPISIIMLDLEKTTISEWKEYVWG
jgi:DNA-directed RNA polymerase subunit RPC12/RpoP